MEGKAHAHPEARAQSIKQQMNASFVDVWESCYPMMKAKLKALPNYQQINSDKDVIQLGLQILET